MGLYRLLPTAARDLETIRDFTASEWGEAQAEKYLTGLRQRLLELSTHPAMAPAAFPGSPVRIALYREHRILYRVSAEGIEVGHVLHQAQKFSRILERFVHLLGR